MKKRVHSKKRGNMDKKIITTLIILVLVFILIISFIPTKQNNKIIKNTVQNQAPPTDEVSCEEKCSQDLNCLNACYYVDINKAVIAKDINLCNKVNPLIMQGCVDKINLQNILKSNDKNACNGLVTQDIRNLCLNILK